jgi:hypothetical protein
MMCPDEDEKARKSRGETKFGKESGAPMRTRREIKI